MVSAGTLLNSTKCFDYLKSKATLSLRWETFTFSTLWQIRLRATNITYNKRGKGRSDALFFHIKYKCVSANLALLTLAVSNYLLTTDLHQPTLTVSIKFSELVT